MDAPGPALVMLADVARGGGVKGRVAGSRARRGGPRVVQVLFGITGNRGRYRTTQPHPSRQTCWRRERQGEEKREEAAAALGIKSTTVVSGVAWRGVA